MPDRTRPPTLIGRHARVRPEAVACLAERHLGLTFDGVAAWTVGPDELADLAYRLRFRDPAPVAEWMTDRAREATGHAALVPAAPVLPAPAPDYLTARETYAEAVAARSPDVAAVRHALHRAVEATVYAPVAKWALLMNDPEALEGGLIAAQGGALTAVCGSELAARLRAGLATEEDVDQYLRLTEAVLKGRAARRRTRF